MLRARKGWALPGTPFMRAMKRIGRPPAEDPMVAVTARLPRSMVEALDTVLGHQQAANPAATRQDVMREAVRRFLATEQRKAKR